MDKSSNSREPIIRINQLIITQVKTDRILPCENLRSLILTIFSICAKSQHSHISWLYNSIYAIL